MVYAQLGLSHNFSQAFLHRKQTESKRYIKGALKHQSELFESLKNANKDFGDMVLASPMDFTRTELDGSTGLVSFTTVPLPLFSALTEFLVNSQRLSEMDMGSITDRAPDYQFLNANGFPGGKFTNKMRSTLGRSVAYLTKEVSTLTAFMETVFTATLVVLAAACLLVMLPLVISLENAKDTLLTSILILPPIILNTLRAQADNHLAAFQSGDDDDVDEEDGGSVMSEDETSVEFSEDKNKGDEVGALLPLNG